MPVRERNREEIDTVLTVFLKREKTVRRTVSETTYWWPNFELYSLGPPVVVSISLPFLTVDARA